RKRHSDSEAQAARRARHARRALACKRDRESEALQGRAGVADATLSTQPSAMWARFQGWRTTAGMQDDCRVAGRLQGCRS
ncbi:MAG: hypothetical protein V3V64_11280, partial [Acidiferrobacterales bacterium]